MNRSSRILLSALTVLLISCSTRHPAAGEFPRDWSLDDDDKTYNEHQQLVGKPMPPLDVAGWVNGEVTPDDMKGKVLLLDFYATWCGPCIEAVPHNNEMMKKYKDKGLLLIGVCTTEEGQDEMESTVKETHMKYPNAKDPKLAAKAAWRVSYYPTYAVVDRTGKLRAIGIAPDHVEEVVEKVLKDDVKK